MLRLVAPDVGLHAAWLASHREWGPGLHEDGFGIAADDEVETSEGFARFVQRVSAPPHARLWWILDEDEVVGGVALRYANAPRVQQQGHVGYGVRPSRRGEGVATWALGEVLRHAAASGLRQVLLVCLDDNIGSIKTIERHDGLFERVVADDGVRLRRYWIDLGDAASTVER
jgi:predicted acetyltransferase